jgi:3-hydroxybutyrate dehydrogenase
MEQTLVGRTALVTGAASGIGRKVASRLAAGGADVIVVDRDEAGAKEVAAEIDGDYHVVDLSDPSVIDSLDLDADILVNNAGLQHVAPVEAASVITLVAVFFAKETRGTTLRHDRVVRGAHEPISR